MSSQDHEDLLRRVALGEVRRDDASVRELAARDPEFARELAETLTIVDALERDGVVAEARAAHAVASSTAASAPTVVGRPRWRLALVATLAVAAALAVLLWTRRKPSGPDDIELGSGVHCLRPRAGESTGYERFQWTLGDTGVSSRIRVYDLAGDKLDEVFVERGAEWRPDAKAYAGWPDRIEWRLEVLDSEDTVVDVDRAHAARGP